MEIAGFEISQEMMEEWVFTYGLQVVGALTIFIIGWMASKIVRKVVANLMKRAGLDAILVSFLSNIIYAIFLAFVVIAALNNLGIQTASLIAVLGAAGLAIGLALQGSLSNFASGVMIILFRHFKLGDFVECGGVMGTVVEMNIFTTTLKKPTNEKVLMPNSTFTSGVLINYTSNDVRRIDHVVGIGYDDDIKKAKTTLWKLIAEDERILDDPEAFVGVDSLGDSSVNLVTRIWVRKEDFGVVKCEFLEAVKTTFDAEGISIPFPQRDVHMIKEAA